MKRKIFALLLAVLLLGSLCLSAAADAYIPPERIEGFDMNYAYMEDSNCKALNTFLSNFVEIGLSSYSQSTRDDAVIAYVLKHLEINAGYYPSDVKKATGDDGKTYMQISESIFEKRMLRLFGRNISADQCPGYENGKITVTAEHFGGPITVFASVYGCYPMGDNVYDVYFDVFRIDQDFSGWYSTSYSNLPWDNLTRLGSGSALVKYAGATPLEDQRHLLEDILRHWTKGAGSKNKPDRAQALDRVCPVPTLEAAIDHLARTSGQDVTVVASSAVWPEGKPSPIPVTPATVREWCREGPVLLCLGTAQGLAPEVLACCHAQIRPLRFLGYNHLSVRSAAAILADRILGDFF